MNKLRAVWMIGLLLLGMGIFVQAQQDHPEDAKPQAQEEQKPDEAKPAKPDNDKAMKQQEKEEKNEDKNQDNDEISGTRIR